MSVTIRRARLDDLEDLLDLREAVAGEGTWIGAELPLDRDGRVVGSLALLTRVGIADLGMNIADGHRGRGVGSALLDAALAWARSVDIHKVELEHWPWNHRARALYERFGFVEEGYRRRQYRRKDGSLWDSVLMGLVLDHDAPGHAERAPEPPRR